MSITWPAVSWRRPSSPSRSGCRGRSGTSGRRCRRSRRTRRGWPARRNGRPPPGPRAPGSPVLALWSGAPEARPARRGLTGHGVGHVLLERQRVDRLRLPASCTRPSRCRAQWGSRSPRTAQEAADAGGLGPSARRHRAPTGRAARAGVDFPSRPVGLERTAAARRTPGADTCPTRACHDHVEPVVLGHGDPDVGRVPRQGGTPETMDRRHRAPVRRTDVGRRRSPRPSRAVGTTMPSETKSRPSAAAPDGRGRTETRDSGPNNTIRQGYRRDLGNLVHGDAQSGCRAPVHSRPCGSTRSYRPWPAVTPSGSTR